MVTAPRHLLAQTRAIADGVADLAGPTALAPESSLNQQVGELRQVESIGLDFGDIDTIRNAHGGSVNDILVFGAVANNMDFVGLTTCSRTSEAAVM